MLVILLILNIEILIIHPSKASQLTVTRLADVNSIVHLHHEANAYTHTTTRLQTN